jgi:exoribonuclease-2
MPPRTTRSVLRAIARRAMVQRGLLPDFPPAALAELQEVTAEPPAGGPPVRDLRSELWMSLDNDSSRDLDQLSVARPLDGGRTRVLVAVADVDARVADGSAIDAHARVNTTTVYTAGGIFRMIPERLSTDVTSLNQDEERLALVVQIDVRSDGIVEASDVYRGRVLNRARLAYDSVAAWLDGDASAPAAVRAVPSMDEAIRLQDRVAQAMRQQRHERGALTLETLEPTVVFDGDAVSDLKHEPKNRAKELIEDFMIAANTATATFLEVRGYPSLRRVLRAPARWDRIVMLARQLGEALPLAPDARALETFLVRRRAADPGRFADVSLSVVKLLGSGEYAVEMPGHDGAGHFGLAARDYTHSTAPNRRFADLVTQRLLKAAIAAAPAAYSIDALAAVAKACTEQGSNAAQVERQVRKAAAALLLASRVGERFDAIVTGASERGTYVRVLAPPVEGRVVEDFAGFDVGDRVRVELVGTDVERGYIDFRGRGEAGR